MTGQSICCGWFHSFIRSQSSPNSTRWVSALGCMWIVHIYMNKALNTGSDETEQPSFLRESGRQAYVDPTSLPSGPGRRSLAGGRRILACEEDSCPRATGMPTGSQTSWERLHTSPSFPLGLLVLEQRPGAHPSEARGPPSWEKQLQRSQRVCGHGPRKPQAPGHLWLSSQKRHPRSNLLVSPSR